MRLFVLLLVASALITAGVRMVLARHGMMDFPNSRSSHAVPVPRGGGVAIVVVFLSAVVWMLEAWHSGPAGLVACRRRTRDFDCRLSRRSLQVASLAAARRSLTCGSMGALVSRFNAAFAVWQQHSHW